jgi:hypothetical protein
MKGSRGSAALDVVIAAAIIVFVIFPVFSAVLEKYVVMNRIQLIKDAVDITNVSLYTAIDAGNLGQSVITMDDENVYEIYKGLLCKNLNLDESFFPEENSVADGEVGIDSLVIYTDELPVTCPEGVHITRPAVHSIVIVPVRPVLYRRMMLKLSGREYIELRVHVDSEIPVDK